MQRGSHAPHCVVAYDAGQGKGGDHGVEGGTGSNHPQTQNVAETTRVHHGLLESAIEWILYHLSLHHRNWLLLLLLLLLLGDLLGWGRRPHLLPILQHDGASDHHVLKVNVEVTLASDRQE